MYDLVTKLLKEIEDATPSIEIKLDEQISTDTGEKN